MHPLLAILAIVPSAKDVPLHPLHQSFTRHAHTFVLLGDAAPADVKLTRLEDMSYDNTSVAPSRTLAKPARFTIVTEQGACVVSSTAEVWVAPLGREAQRGIEIDPSACGSRPALFALEGDPPIRADLPRPASVTDAAEWAERVTGKTVIRSGSGEAIASSQALPLTNLVAIDTAFDDHSSTLLLRRNDELVLELRATYLIGELRWSGRDFLIVSDAKGLHAITVSGS